MVNIISKNDDYLMVTEKTRLADMPKSKSTPKKIRQTIRNCIKLKPESDCLSLILTVIIFGLIGYGCFKYFLVYLSFMFWAQFGWKCKLKFFNFIHTNWCKILTVRTYLFVSLRDRFFKLCRNLLSKLISSLSFWYPTCSILKS